MQRDIGVASSWFGTIGNIFFLSPYKCNEKSPPEARQVSIHLQDSSSSSTKTNSSQHPAAGASTAEMQQPYVSQSLQAHKSPPVSRPHISAQLCTTPTHQSPHPYPQPIRAASWQILVCVSGHCIMMLQWILVYVSSRGILQDDATMDGEVRRVLARAASCEMVRCFVA